MKSLELTKHNGQVEAVGVSETTKLKPVVIFTVDEKRPVAFVLVRVQANGTIGVYHEADALTIGN